MKKRKNQLERIENVINNDRLSCSEDFLKLLTIDLQKVFNEYFTTLSQPLLQFSKDKGNYIVNIQLVATGIKQFMSVPK